MNTTYATNRRCVPLLRGGPRPGRRRHPSSPGWGSFPAGQGAGDPPLGAAFSPTATPNSAPPLLPTLVRP
jgi:hypothetical protein